LDFIHNKLFFALYDPLLKTKNTNIHRTKEGESRSDIYPACLIPGMLNYIYFLKNKEWFVEIKHCKLTISELSITDDESQKFHMCKVIVTFSISMPQLNMNEYDATACSFSIFYFCHI
jgi:hypothetical protein